METIKFPVYETLVITGTGQALRSPAVLCGVCLAGDGGNAEADVYDGENTNGRRLVHLEVLSGTTFNWEPSCGARVNNGIHVVATATYGVVTLTFKPLERHE